MASTSPKQKSGDQQDHDKQDMQDEATARAIEAGVRLANPLPGEEIVITGMAGRFPDSDDMYEYRDKLYNKVDLVSCDNRRWEPTHPEIPQRTGKINHISKFDAGFFGIHYRQAHTMDPMARMAIERAYEAIVDAGVNPLELRGRNIGVYVGACFAETEKTWFYDKLAPKCFGITGCSRAMIAKRISYWLGLKGPSMTVDSACSSSLYALENAYKAIRAGQCESALVGGTTLCLHPYVSLQFARLGVLSPDGTCKSFDESANGYARSETIAMIYLQKAQDAKRIYAHVIHAKTNCDGYKEQGITYPSGEMQQQLLDEFYEECKVDPSTLSFVEAHGTGTKVGDPEEISALDEVFCKNRLKPLPIGSVKSNLGHTEPASGLCSIAKVVLGMECGYMLPNIHYKRPREGVTALLEGRMKVVTEPTPWDGELGLVGVNSFGFGGANCHVLLQWNPKKKVNMGVPRDDMKRLVCVSGRTEESINSILDDIQSRKLDAEYIGLVHEVFTQEIPGHQYRGYSILTKNGVEKRSLGSFEGAKRPLWYIFGGLANEWFQSTTNLFKLDVFSAVIDSIDNILGPKGIEIRTILSSADEKVFENKLFTSIVVISMQIALYEVLKYLGVVPDQVIGYAAGEIACGYADGSLSLEEAVLIAYYRGLACTESSNPKDAAARVQKYLKQLLPKPKARSNKWLSTSIPSSHWSSELAHYASADYFTNNLVGPVMVEDVVKCIPREAVILEIGGKAPTTNINLSVDVSIIELVQKNSSNGMDDVINSIGKLYEVGYNPQVQKLYPKVQFPVSRGTPMLSPLVKWDHSEDWFVTCYKTQEKAKSGERKVTLDVNEEEWKFLSGHVIDGRNLFPATGYLELVWETLAMMVGMMVSDMCVVFENVRFNRATNVPEKGKLELICMVQRGSGNFEVIEGGAAIVTGRIYIPKDINEELTDLPLPVGRETDDLLPLKERDIYKELRLRGYNYSGQFRGIVQCDNIAERGLLKWSSNWVAYADTMLQMQILSADTRNLYVPTSIQRLSIDAKRHVHYVQEFGEDPKVPVYVHRAANIIRSGAIEIRGLNASSIARRKPLGEPVLETYRFAPNSIYGLTAPQSIRICMQIALENMYGIKVHAVELVDEVTKEDSEPLAPIIAQVLGDQPLIQAEITILSKKHFDLPNITVEDKKLTTESNCLLVVATNVLSRPPIQQQAIGVLKEGGFVLSRESQSFNASSYNGNELDVLLEHSVGDEKLLLLRRSVDWKRATVIDISETTSHFEWLPKLQAAVKNDAKVIVVAQKQPLSGIVGLCNCLRREPGGDAVKCVFIVDNDAPAFDPEREFYKTQLKKDMAVNIYKNGAWGTYRHLSLEEVNTIETQHAYVNVTVRGDLSSLKWIEGPLKVDSVMEPEKTLVNIYYAAINFRDVMTASGKLSADVVSKDRLVQECIQGFEFSGRTTNGKRVMGMVTSGALSTLLAADSYLLWDIPDHWTMEEAATIPVVYGTVMYAIFMVGSLGKGSSILIHAGSGGVGQAAINVALHNGCKVFTTVGTQEKRDFIKKQFPQITDAQIGNSRDTSFEQMVMRETGGRGVDFVLNSLAEEKLQASVRCLAKGGKFLEIGKFDLANNNPLGLALFLKEASFHGVMLDALFVGDPGVKMQLSTHLMEGIKKGSVKPLSRTVFKDDEVEQAFRYMAAGKHIGKALINVREEEKDLNILPSYRLRTAVPRYFCSPDNSYIIAGGLGGFGLELADWLVLRGARKLVLNSRNGLKNGYQAMRIRTWKTYGAFVKVSTADITTREGCKKLVEEANDMGPVEGIFNLAVILKDAILENQNVEMYQQSFGPKALATKHLDAISRELCPHLRDFVIFSSVSCGRGNAGQTNYGMANSVMERICEKRRAEGFPALAIEWGAIGEVGLVADMQENHTELEIGGTLQQRLSSCLQVMDSFLRQKEPIVSSMVVAEKKSGSGGAANVVDAVANILGLRNLKTVSLHSTLAELGMDSMMAVEIKQTLEREFEVFLTAQDIRSMTFSRLDEIAAEKEEQSGSGDKKTGAAVPAAATPLDQSVLQPNGFSLLVRNIGMEGTSSVPVVRLQSLVEEDDVNARTAFIVPGIEAVATVMEPLCFGLDAHALCLQLGYEHRPATIQEMAENLLKHMKKKLSKTEEFVLIGYSFGTAVTVWLASLLEAEGRKGTVILIDGAPEMLMELTRHNLQTDSESEFQTSMLGIIMSTYMSTEAIFKCRSTMLKCSNFDERVAVAMSNAPESIPHSQKYQKAVCVGLYQRLQALMDYTAPETKIRSPVKLFRPTQFTVANFDEDYRLHKIAENVEIKYFEGNHLTLLESPPMVQTINSIINSDRIHFKKSLLNESTNILSHTEQTVKQI